MDFNSILLRYILSHCILSRTEHNSLGRTQGTFNGFLMDLKSILLSLIFFLSALLCF